MYILYATNMYPRPEQPQSGIFITQRIEALRSLGVDVFPFAFVKDETNFVKWLRKTFKGPRKHAINSNSIQAPSSDVVYEVVRVRMTFFGKLMDIVTGRRYFAYAAFRELSRMTCNINYDLIHEHWLYPTGLTALLYAKKRKIPCVITCHGSDVNRDLPKKAYNRFALKVLENADVVEFVSNALLQSARKNGYKGSQYVILPNGIEGIPLIDQLDKDIPVVGFVGNLIPVKRVDEMPSIFRRIYDGCKGKVIFHIIGQGDYRSWLEEQTSNLPVVFFGQVPHEKVISLMAEMNVMILPSRSEGWPCVVLEANSCGTPVVGSNNGGIPEAIGDSRLVVEDNINFIEQFSDRVIQVINGNIPIDREELRKRSEKFLWVELQRKSLSQYSRLITGDKGYGNGC